MKMLKNERGITVVILVVTIILLLIIAGVSIYVGTSSINDVKDELLLTELCQVKSFVGQSYLNYVKYNNTNSFLGTTITNAQANTMLASRGITPIYIPSSYSASEKAYYRLTPEDLNNAGVENCQNTYIVNYITGEVMNESVERTSDGVLLYSSSRDSFENSELNSFSQNMTNEINSERQLFNTL